MQSKKQKQRNAIEGYQKAIDSRFENIRTIEANVNPSSAEAKLLIAAEEDKISKLEKHIRFTEIALKEW
jgi:hypothetical protein